MRRMGLFLVLMFLGAGTLMGQVPMPGQSPLQPTKPAGDGWGAPQGQAKSPNVGSVPGGRKVIATTNTLPKQPQANPLPPPSVVQPQRQDPKIESIQVKPVPVPGSPAPKPPALMPPIILTNPHSLAPAVMPIPNDGLDQISVQSRTASQTKPSPPTVVRVVSESQEPKPTGPAVTEPVKGQLSGVTLEKKGPEFHNLGQPFRYEIIVRNPGATAVVKLRVTEELPSGAKCLSVEPQAELQGQNLIWDLGNLESGAEKKLTIEVQQATEGEFQSTASATFVTSPWRMRITRPELTINQKGPDNVQVGDEVAFEIQVTNPGSGPALNVLIHDHLPPGLQHPQGSDIEADLGTLAPGQTRNITVRATAIEPGVQINEVGVRADGGLQAQSRAEVRVTKAGLKVKKTGPEVIYLHHELEHRLEVTNTGQAPATGVRLTDALPEGLEFLSASEGGTHDPKTRTVEWVIGTLTPGQSRVVVLQMKAKAAGDWINKATARADRGLESTDSAQVHVEGVPALLLEVVDLDDPLEMGAETDYEIRVVNQGTSPVAKVSIRAMLPEGLEFVRGEGPTGYRMQGQEVLFDPIEKLTAKADALFKVRVKGRKQGDWRFQVYLNSTQLTRPVLEEESTEVYNDQKDAPMSGTVAPKR